MEKVLLISVSGIGNTILQLPLIKSVAKQQGEFLVDVLFGSKEMAALLTMAKDIRRRFVLPGGFMAKAHLVKALRKEKYSWTVACYPSNRPEFHLLPFIIGARKRVIHSYPDSRSPFAILSNRKIDAKSGLHDVEQNLNLLKCMGIETNVELPSPLVSLPDHLEHDVSDYMKKAGLSGHGLLGIHPGSGPIAGKRWPLEYFAASARILLKRGLFSHVLVFGGPEEASLKGALVEMIGPERAVSVDAPFLLTAALISVCEFMLSNDSGLMHVAAAVATPVLGIFGPTDWHRTAPRGRHANFLAPDMRCAPCLAYPLKSSRARIRCKGIPECLRTIGPDQVADRIGQLLNRS